MDVYRDYLNLQAKTEPPLTLFEHSSDVLQVLDYLISQNSIAIHHRDLIRTAALVHDIGKMARDLSGGRWVHAPHSANFLDDLLVHPRFCELLRSAQVDFSKVNRELLLKICERHHHQSPELLHSCKDAVLIGIADALASAIETGTLGKIADVLARAPYLQASLELAHSLGFPGGLSGELHYVDLPGRSVQDLILADMIFRVMDSHLQSAGVIPVLQRGARLCVVGPKLAVKTVLDSFAIDPQRLYSAFFEDQIYDSVSAQFAAGSMQIDVLRYLLITDSSARRMAIALYTRDKPRLLLEKHNLSELIDDADQIFVRDLSNGIDKLWEPIRLTLQKLAPALKLPDSPSSEVEKVARGELRRPQIALFLKRREGKKSGKARQDRSLDSRASHNQRILEALATENDGKRVATEIEEFLKLFDASQNAFRSITNILLETLKMRSEVAAGTYTMPLSAVAWLDMAPMDEGVLLDNESLCPVCRRFPQKIKAPALITGRSEGDSSYYASQGSREGAIFICSWCFIAGYIDLPIAKLGREGNSIVKSAEYLITTSPLPVTKLQWLVDFIHRGPESEAEQNGQDFEQHVISEKEDFKQLEAMLGVNTGFDELAILGRSRKRLANLKGLVLPSTNLLANYIVIRIPFERLVGEDNVSGAVQRELVKATMHEFKEVTGAASMHYMISSDAAFSVSGRPVDGEDMRRAHVAYQIANQHARVGKYRQLNSSLFMLLLTAPRHAITRVLRIRRRQEGGRYAPGEMLITEVIEMTESLAQQDWKFVLGQRITSTLVDLDLLPKARSFWKNPREKFSGVELTKWLQRLKMAHDESTLRQWGTQLINALKAGRVASREFREERGLQVGPPSEDMIAKVLTLVEEIISTCALHKCKLSEFSREIAEMDYYLLFYFNQKAKERSHDPAPGSSAVA